jgi:molecular chaperone DnaK
LKTYFGIDFGTTNSSAVRYIEEAGPIRFGDDAGRPLPSIVAIDKALGEVECGRSAWENREEYTESGQYHVVESIKWDLGTNRVWETEARVWTAEDIAAEIFKKLSKRAEVLTLEPITHAVISIPVGYPPAARAALRRASSKAGIRVASFVTESTAALIRYLPQLRHFHHVAVFDWGGGTLDISVLKIDGSNVYEVATEGMDIAGDAIDVDFAKAIHTRAMEARGQTTPFENMSSFDRDNLRIKCETAKCQLSSVERTQILLTNYGGQPLRQDVDRAWFDQLITVHVDLAIESLTRTIEEANLSLDAINRIIVIGGSSNLPLLHKKLGTDKRFAAAVLTSESAEWAVAEGAAWVESSEGTYETAESIGLILSDNSYYELIQSGERPFSSPKAVSLSLVEDSRTANIIIAKRGFDQASGLLSRILEFGVDTMGFDLEQIDLSYFINEDLVLMVEGMSRASGMRSRNGREFQKLRFSYHL